MEIRSKGLIIREWIGRNWFVCVLLILGFIRYWMAVNTNYMIAQGPHDDELAIHQGRSLLDGNWLGTYNQYTLIKGIVYPVFVALVKLLGFTYGQGMGILIVASGLIMVGMLKKINANRVFLLLAYGFVIFLPIGYLGRGALKIYRNAISPWLILILLSCIIVIYLQRKRPWRESWPWIIGAAVTFTCIYYLREDMMWLYPLVIVALILAAFGHYRKTWKQLVKGLLFVLLPWIMVGVTGIGISTINYHYYGVFCISDRTSGNFSEMMSLILSVKDDDANEDIWCTQNMLNACIEASPTLQSMEEEIHAASKAWGSLQNGSESYEVRGDFMQWVLRDAFTNAGYYVDAVETDRMIGNVVSELREAYAEDRLQSDEKIHVSSQARGMTLEELFNYVGVATGNILKMPQYDGCENTYPYYATFDENLIGNYEVMLSESFSPRVVDSREQRITAKVSDVFLEAYRVSGYPLFVLGIIVFASMMIDTVVDLKKKRWKRQGDIFVINAGIILSSFLLIYIVTVFCAFLAEVNYYDYTTGFYILLALFEIFMVDNLIKKIKFIKNRRKK